MLEVFIWGYIRCLVPVRHNIIKIKFDNGPQSVCDEGDVIVSQEPVCVSDQRR